MGNGRLLFSECPIVHFTFGIILNFAEASDYFYIFRTFSLNILKIKNPDDDVQRELPYVERFDGGFHILSPMLTMTI